MNIASVLGQVGSGGAAGYVAAKHGVVGLTRAAALDYATQGVRVNAVGPGYIDTPLLDTLPPRALTDTTFLTAARFSDPFAPPPTRLRSTR